MKSYKLIILLLTSIFLSNYKFEIIGTYANSFYQSISTDYTYICDNEEVPVNNNESTYRN